MKRIIAIGASNSSKSINQQFASWAAHQVEDAEVTVLDLNEYEMPIYSIQQEQGQGVPEKAHQWKSDLSEADGIIISFAEHNSSYTAAFKNIFDWASRLEGTVWQDKPMLLMATSPGPRGAQTVLSTAKSSFPYHGAKVAGSFSLPSFNQNFNKQHGITEEALGNEFGEQLRAFENLIESNKLAA